MIGSTSQTTTATRGSLAIDICRLLNEEMVRAEQVRERSTAIILAALEVVRTSQSLRRQTTFDPAPGESQGTGPNTK